MTYISADPKTTKHDIEFDLDTDPIETVLNRMFSQWLREQRLDIYLQPGHVIAYLEDTFAYGSARHEGTHYTYRTSFAEFFHPLNTGEDGQFEQFLLEGLRVYRETYGKEPGAPWPEEDED